MDDEIKRYAKLSPCRNYRYGLSRWWTPQPSTWVLWVMLNPSTADAMKDDHTIRRCIAFSRQWGYHGLHVANLFAYRSTDPDALASVADPVGPLMYDYLSLAAHGSDQIICAWGSHKVTRRADTGRVVGAIGKPLYCLGTTKTGAPRHPLYLPDATPVRAYHHGVHPAGAVRGVV